jgi:hypothetical protein
MDFRETVRLCGLVSDGLEQDPVAGCCEHGYERSGFVTSGNFLIDERQLAFEAHLK